MLQNSERPSESGGKASESNGKMPESDVMGEKGFKYCRKDQNTVWWVEWWIIHEYSRKMGGYLYSMRRRHNGSLLVGMTWWGRWSVKRASRD
jgi:hypothetical protein